MTEYCRGSESLTIYHIGAHKCPLKPDTNKYSKQVRDVVLRNSGIGDHGIPQAELGQAVANSDIKEAHRRAMQLSYTNIRFEKAKVAHERNSEKHSLEAVGMESKLQKRKTSTSFTKLITHSLMDSQITYLKAVLPWLSWQLIWTRMTRTSLIRQKSLF